MKKQIVVPSSYDLRSVIQSHGWSDLAPFRFHSDTSISVALRIDDKPIDVTVWSKNKKVFVEGKVLPPGTIRTLRYMFRMDDDMEDFYRHARSQKRVWIEKKRMGRMLRSQSIYEDVVKMILTTNCSWAFTKKMVQSLVDHLGEKTPDGVGLFPTAKKLASGKENFFREKIRSGYRSPHLPNIGKIFSKRTIDTDRWFLQSTPTADIRKEILSIPGAGPYVADNILKLLGRFDYLGIDSWVRKQLQEMWNKKNPITDAQIKKAYAVHHKYQGLILWCDVTQAWLK